MADVQVRTSVELADHPSPATTATSIGTPPSQHRSAKPEAVRVGHSLGKPSRKKTLEILDLLVVLVTWICLPIAVIAITPRLDVAWTLRLQHQLQVLGLMLSIMSQCLRILAPKLWVMAEAWCSRPKLQNFDAIIRNSILTSNTLLVWRALLLAFILLPIGLSLAYKVFVGGNSTHDFGSHASWYGMTGAPGLTRNTVLKFGPSYMTNATLPFILASADYDTIEASRNDDAFWDFYLNQLGWNSAPDSFSLGIVSIDLSSNKTLGMLTGSKTDASWMILSFVQQKDREKFPDIWIPAFRANAFLFNTRREICKATWRITYNSIQLVDGSCSVSSPLPSQPLLVTSAFDFSTYYLPSLAEYLAPLSTASNATPTEQNVYVWGNQWLMSTFTTTIAGMYWSRMTALFGPDNFNNSTLPPWNNEVNYTVPDTLLSNRQTMNPTWALYVVLGVQPVLISFIFIASFVLSYFSAVDGGSFGIVAILAGVRTETLKIFDGASFSGTLRKPVVMQIDTITAKRERTPQIEYSFYDDGNPPEPSVTATLQERFIPSRLVTRKTTGYQRVDE